MPELSSINPIEFDASKQTLEYQINSRKDTPQTTTSWTKPTINFTG